jgi:hypothetical protein
MLICRSRRVCVCFLNEYTRPENSSIQIHSSISLVEHGDKVNSPHVLITESVLIWYINE